MQLSLATRLVYVFLVVCVALSNPTGERQCLTATAKASTFPLLDDISIEDLHVLLDNGSLTSVNLVRVCLFFLRCMRPGTHKAILGVH